MAYIIKTALELGLLYAPIPLALFLSFRILNIADMTTDGCFVLGAVVSVTWAAAGHPILGIFLAMAAGLICGMGYFLYAAVFTLVICLALIILKLTGFGEARDEKELHITIPEDLDYEGMFDEIFEKYALERKLISVKTTDMGSLFRLKYHVTLRNGASEKEFIDKLRIRNGNLPITICISQPADSPAQL